MVCKYGAGAAERHDILLLEFGCCSMTFLVVLSTEGNRKSLALKRRPFSRNGAPLVFSCIISVRTAAMYEYSYQ